MVSLPSSSSGSNLELPYEASPVIVTKKFKTSASFNIFSAFSSHLLTTTGLTFPLSIKGILFSFDCFYFRQGWDGVGVAAFQITWEGTLQSNQTYSQTYLRADALCVVMLTAPWCLSPFQLQYQRSTFLLLAQVRNTKLKGSWHFQDQEGKARE